MAISNNIHVASAIPSVTIGNTTANINSIIDLCSEMDKAGIEVAVFPELCITGYTCADLFHNSLLIESASDALRKLIKESAHWNLAAIVGLPLLHNGALFNVAAVVHKGRLLGFVPKTYIPNYNEFYEKRWWVSGQGISQTVEWEVGCKVLLDSRQIFIFKGVKFAIEICEDLWTPLPPSTTACLAGAEIVFNLSATDVLVGKFEYIKNLVLSQSAKCIGGYVYASAGYGESSTDLVFDGLSIIASNGNSLTSDMRWNKKPHYTSAIIELETLRHDRLQKSSFHDCANFTLNSPYLTVDIPAENVNVDFRGKPDRLPFVPKDINTKNSRAQEIIEIQCAALAQRLQTTHCRNLVVGVSGGLDSTLALLVAVRTFDILGLPREGIHAITMPGFGTSNRTYVNAVSLIKQLKVSFREISIIPAVTQHFADIGHPEELKDVTYENSQARQRTLLLMDIANQVNGFVLGTGDMSELALGWATYNGDHMSMYGVNAGVPKTLVRSLVEQFSHPENDLLEISEKEKVSDVLKDIIDTPISPELIPTDADGSIAQKTEELVGPYELHDFFLYYFLRYGLTPLSIYQRAVAAFEETYSRETILKWLKNFHRRFFAQQFKRSCLPDGPKVGSVCLSPRGDWRMPSDANCGIWLAELDDIEKSFSEQRKH